MLKGYGENNSYPSFIVNTLISINDAIIDIMAPNIKGAAGEIYCHKIPAIKLEAKEKIPIAPLYSP